MCKASKISILAVIAATVVFPLTSALAGGEVICNPCIFVTSQCSTNLVALCNSNAASIRFSGTVSNCSVVTLTNVVLTDDLVGGTVLSLGSLAPFTSAPWSANYLVSGGLCGRSNVVNTVTAIATGFCSAEVEQPVTNSATCDFSVFCPSSSLTITKACASPIVTNVGSSLTVTGMVCNTGGVDLTNVYIVDNQPGLPTTATNVIGLLPAGQCSAYSFTYIATSCDPNHDVVTAEGNTPCGGPPVVATASADCFLCCPGISIQTLLGCLQPGATCPPSGPSYAQTATGVKGDTGDPTQDNPAFCYIVLVRNTGHDPLTNIVIHDDQLGALGIFPGPLAVGGTITISNLRTKWGATTTNFTSVTAQCGSVHGNGAAVGATTNAVATVLQAGIVCQKLVSVNGGTPAPAVTNDCSGGTNVITWYVAVTNSGEALLCNIVITELGTGPDLLPCGAVNIALTNCLAPGDGTGLIPVCTSVLGCAETNIENSIRVIGTVASISNTCAINITGSNIVAESQCAASVTLRRAALSITKACASGILTNVGSSLTVTGMVCNLGDQDLTNVTIVDSQPGIPVGATNVIDLLPAGQCSGYSFTYTATSCDPNHDVVTAIGSTLSGALVGPVSASADCFLCCPGISIQTRLACLLPGATCPPSSASYNLTATGVKGDTGDPTQDNPAFCYIVVVRNTGHDPLTNIVIFDDQLGQLGTFPGPLAVGGTITISNLRTNWDTTTTNTSMVSAQCGGVHGNGAVVSASTNLVATVVQAGITVQKLVSVNGSTPVQVATPACGTIASNITWYVNITNTSEATLCNIQVTELGLGPDLLPCGAVSIALTNCLAPGQETGLIPLCTFGFNTCVATNLENSIRVTAQVAAVSNACTINITGSNVVVQGQCSANLSLCCTPPAPEPGCRVTGGGRQDSPETCPDDVRFVTHGGQVGGPFGSSSCVVTLDQINGNRCIQGRWTHVRHTEGGLEGNFHARLFDTLACACLGDGFASTNTCEYEQGVVTNGICNPAEGNGHSDRRLGPANKIAFTGVGEWVDPEGRRQPHTTLFRVDIEDRGEPGGAKPIDGDRPADRYRIRIWVLTPDEVLRLNDPTDGLINIPAGCDSCTTVSRNAIRACLGITFQDGVCGPNTCAANANDQACFTLPGSIPVRLPDIDDGGELKNGNEQIRSQLKICP